MSSKVNRPVDIKAKERDVNTKLQLYGIFQAFANGKVPSNKQIDVALNSALATKPLTSPSKKLSPEGQKLVGDLKNVIEQAKILVLTKNEGNLLQDFVWQTQQISGGNASTPNAPVDSQTAKQHGQDALEGLRTLGTLILSNGQFRKLLKDATVLFRDIAGDAATKAANKVNPNEEQLRGIDEPAPDDTWHDVPSRGDLKDQFRQKYNEQKPFGRGELQDAAGNATQAAHPGDSRDPADAANLAARDQQYNNSSGVDAQAGARTAVNQLRDQASQNIPDDTKDRARGQRDRAKNYLLNEKFPQERRDQTIFRLKKMVVEIQGHQDYQRAIDTLLRLAEEYTGHSKNIVGQTHGTVKDAHTDDSLQLAEADLKTLIERFANSTSLDDLFDSINNIYRDADRDEQLKQWFRDMDGFIRKCLKEQGYIMNDDATDTWNQLYDRGHYLLRERYRNHTDRIADEFRFLGNQFDEDPQNRAFADALTKLFTDLGNDENGKTTFKPHLVKDLSEVILPGLFENIRYVPIPRIEYSDPMIDAIVENLVIESDNLAPNVFELGSDNYWRWGRKSISKKNKNKVMIAVSGVQMDLRDVSYYVKKKEGFPSITDKGVMDVFMGGEGLSFKVHMETADKTDRQHFFKINKVDVNVKNLSIKLKQSNHKLLFGLFKPLLLKVMRPALQKVLEKQIKDNVNQLDGIAWNINQEAERAKKEALENPDPENIQNIYQRYFSAAQQQLLKARQKKDEIAAKTADKHVNVAVTQHDSMFKNISLPGGISSKATEYKELAAKGDKWESPVFSIGSAKETSNLPKVPAVTRKPHNVTQGGIRDVPATGGASNYANGGPTKFSQEMDRAFDNNATGGVNGIAGSNSQYGAKDSGHTTLGAGNPVLTGSV